MKWAFWFVLVNACVRQYANKIINPEHFSIEQPIKILTSNHEHLSVEH